MGARVGLAYAYTFVAIKRLGAGQFYLIAIRGNRHEASSSSA
jgi:hypothetical protein